MTKSTELPTTSATTGPRNLASVLPSVIGQPPGETGSDVKLVDLDRIASHLARQAPAETDRNLQVSLRRQCGLLSELTEEARFPADGPMYSVVSRALFAPDADGGPVDLPRAIAMVQQAMTPALGKDLAAALTRLRALTKARKEAGIDTELQAAAYIEELRGYPADIALHTLQQWPSRINGMWWPSWNELQRVLNAKVSGRRAMLAKLKRMAEAS